MSKMGNTVIYTILSTVVLIVLIAGAFLALLSAAAVWIFPNVDQDTQVIIFGFIAMLSMVFGFWMNTIIFKQVSKRFNMEETFHPIFKKKKKK